MPQKVLSAARTLADRAAIAGRRGSLIPPGELDRLIADLAIPFPAWLRALWGTVPLCGLELGWQAFEPEGDYDGVAVVEWSDAGGVHFESIKGYPGRAIRGEGYVNVGGDAGGGGDPYFVNVHEGDDPPLYQVYHDVSDQADRIIAEARRIVSPRLSDFFATAKLAR